MKNLIVIIVFLGAALVACSPRMESPAASETDPTNLQAAQVKMAGIQTDTLQRRTMTSSIECTGMVGLPPQSIQFVHAPHHGFVGTVPQIVGDYVRKGQILTTVSHPDLLTKQRQYLEGKVAVRTLEKDFQRKKNLAATEAGSQLAREQAELAYQQADIQTRALKKELETIGINVPKLEETGELQASIPILAPRSGYIDAIHARPGKLCQPEETLYQILDLSHIHLELQVLAKDMHRIQEDQRVRIQLAGREEVVEATIHRLSPSVDPETKTYGVHAHLRQPEAAREMGLMPGAFIQAQIILQETQTWVMPNSGVLRSGAGDFVFLAEEDNYRKVPVKVGLIDETYTEILNPQPLIGKNLVTRGAYYANSTIEEADD